MKSELADYLDMIDLQLFGKPRYGACYILSSSTVALIDPGTSHSLGLLWQWFHQNSVPLEDVEAICLTHVHLDHGGAAAYLVRNCPNATVYVHERGAPHLASPEKLLESVKDSTGERAPFYGTTIPIEEDRIVALGERTTISAGGREIEAIPTPGHAPHHLAFFEKTSSLLFPGDAAGIYLDGQLIPTTPPPSFDLEGSLRAIEELKSLGPDWILYPHFGAAGGAGELLQNYGSLLEGWVSGIRTKWHELDDTESLLEEIKREKEEILGGGFGAPELEMNVRGVLNYLRYTESQQ